jgi:hypothetical protein
MNVFFGRFSLPTDCVFICFGKKSIGLKAVGEIVYNTAFLSDVTLKYHHVEK